jgi:hypothetical protein
LSFFTNKAYTQDLRKNSEKYYFYRHRLSKYFVRVGEQPGESLVCQGRNGAIKNQICLPYSLNYNNTDLSSELMAYDDEPNILGWYIGLLATEWKLVNDEGGDVSEITKELFYALEAINRLVQTDMGIGNTALDGSIIRDSIVCDGV